jgi:hypothetical protein
MRSRQRARLFQYYLKLLNIPLTHIVETMNLEIVKLIN